MCIYIYIFIHIEMYVYTYKHIYICIHTHTLTYLKGEGGAERVGLLARGAERDSPCTQSFHLMFVWVCDVFWVCLKYIRMRRFVQMNSFVPLRGSTSKAKTNCFFENSRALVARKSSCQNSIRVLRKQSSSRGKKNQDSIGSQRPPTPAPALQAHIRCLQGYLAHEKQPPPLGPP